MIEANAHGNPLRQTHPGKDWINRRDALTVGLDIAESLGDTEYRLRALRGLYSYHAGTRGYHAALPFAQKFHDLATTGSNPNDRLFGERMMGVAKHYLGDQAGARRHLEQVLRHYTATDRGPDVIRFHTDLRISARVYLARVLWLQGFADQAVRTAEMSIGEAEATGHALSLCSALALAACPIALWVGNLAAAAHYTSMLLDHSSKHNLQLWNAIGSGFQRVVAIRGDNLDTELQLLRTEPNEVAGPDFSFRFWPGLVEALANSGRIAEARALVEAGIEQFKGGWVTPELLRLKGDLLLQSAPEGAEMAEDLFLQALDGARRQEMLAWELRVATSLARLRHIQGRIADGTATLQPVYDRFTEGFETADLLTARRLLDELCEAGRG